MPSSEANAWLVTAPPSFDQNQCASTCFDRNRFDRRLRWMSDIGQEPRQPTRSYSIQNSGDWRQSPKTPRMN